MSEAIQQASGPQAGTRLPTVSAPRLPILPLGLSLGIFLAITFVLCVGFDLLFPGPS